MFIIDHFEVRDDDGKAVSSDEEAVSLNLLCRHFARFLLI